MLELIQAHPVISTLLGYFTFSSIVTGMPTPTTSSSQAYQWAYRSLNVMAANIGTLMHAKFPEMASLPENLPAGSAVEHKETTVVVTPKP